MGTSSDWTCKPREHNFQPMPRVALPPTAPTEWEPARIFCTLCGWIRRVDEIQPTPTPEQSGT